MKTLQDLVVEAINELSVSDLVALNNTYAIENSIEGEVYENDEEFFSVYFSGGVFEALRAAHFGEYKWNEDYVRFNGYGNLESFQYFDTNDLCELPQVIAEHIIENPDEYSSLIDIDELTEQLEESE